MALAMDSLEPGLRYRIRRALRQISDQHRALHEIHGRLAGALEADDRREASDAFVRFRHALGAHFELEEEVFFPALHGLHPEEGADLEALGREHGALLAALQRIAPLLEAAPLERFSTQLAGFRGELGAHERREEGLVSRLAEPPVDAV
jgi:hypothetical protein